MRPNTIDAESLYSTDPIRACRLALRRTRNASSPEERLEQINIMLGMFGVEVVRGEYNGAYFGDARAEYANAGDPYAPTVFLLLDEHFPRFAVMSLGDYAEREMMRNKGR